MYELQYTALLYCIIIQRQQTWILSTHSL